MARDRFDTSVQPKPLSWSSGVSGTGYQPLKPLSPSEWMSTGSTSANPYLSQQSSGTGSTGSFGGDLSVLDQYNDAFAQAGAKYGIDPNWLKSVAATERGWEGTSVAGAQGLMQIMPGGYPALEAMYPNWQTDPVQNIMLGAAILDAKRQEQGGDLNRGTMGYLGFGGPDAYGTDASEYLASVQNYYGQLGSNGGSLGGGVGGSLGSMFANGAVPDWGEFGAESNNGLYGYGTQYGLNGTQHTGVDVPMARGSSYRAPMGGTVMCAGTGVGPGTDGGGCAAFTDQGGGAGRVEVLLDNGVVLIFGHSSASALQPGQRFNAGDVLGFSGGYNSDHVHLEARVRDASMPSGWRIVDPRTVIGGGGSYGSAGSSYGGTTASTGQTLNQMILSFLGLR